MTPKTSVAAPQSPGAPRRWARLAVGWALALGVGAAVPSLFAGRVPIAVFLGMAAVAAGLIVLARRRWDLILRLPRAGLAQAAALTLAVWLISALWTLDPQGSPIVWLEVALVLALCTLIGLGLIAAPERIDDALRVLLVASGFAIAVGLIAIHLWPPLLEAFRTRAIGNAYEARMALKSYGSALPLLAPVLIWAGWRMGGGWRALGLILVPLALWLTVSADSSAGLLGFAGAAVVLAAGWAVLRLPARAATLVAAGCGLALIAGLIVLVQFLPPLPYSGPDTIRLPAIDAHRQVIWSFAVDQTWDAPVFGHGLNTAGRLPGAKAIIPGIGQEYIPSHPHSWLFQVTVETGFVGLAALLAAIAALAWRVGRAASAAGGGHGAAWAAIGAAGAFLISGLVNFSFWAAWWQASILLLIALCLAAAPLHRAAGRNKTST
jgi:O-antigen ligase